MNAALASKSAASSSAAAAQPADGAATAAELSELLRAVRLLAGHADSSLRASSNAAGSSESTEQGT
jgi:hypothetical protein